MRNQNKLRQSSMFICSSFSKATMMSVLAEVDPVLLQRSNVTPGQEIRPGTDHAPDKRTRDDWHFLSLVWIQTLLFS